MNLSGVSVLSLVNYFKIDLSDLLVVFDDVDLIELRFRLKD